MFESNQNQMIDQQWLTINCRTSVANGRFTTQHFYYKIIHASVSHFRFGFPNHILTWTTFSYTRGRWILSSGLHIAAQKGLKWSAQLSPHKCGLPNHGSELATRLGAASFYPWLWPNRASPAKCPWAMRVALLKTLGRGRQARQKTVKRG